MGESTGIGWTDSTWNPLRGCSRVSPGCVNCYAEAVAGRFSGPGQPYEGLAEIVTIGAGTLKERKEPHWTGKLRFIEEHLRDPLKWKRPRRIFVNSMSDLFHESVEQSWIDKIFTVMALASQHTFQILTKRPERMLAELSRLSRSIAPLEQCARDLGYSFKFHELSLLPWPIRNVWLGVSVENQKYADERIPLLLQTPAAVRFISYEPALGPIDLTRLPAKNQCTQNALRGRNNWNGCMLPRLDWVICGGESGANRREFKQEWAESVMQQCKEAGVAFYMKQMSAITSKKAAALIPPHLLIQEFPDRLTLEILRDDQD